MRKQIRPARLRDGATIGVVSPAYWLEPERLQRATRVFEDLGFNLQLGRSTELRQDIYAGPAEARARDIMAMFANPDIDAIVCARGGYGGNRVLPLLDYDLIRQNAKIFVGFSDTTGALSAIAQRSGVVTFHGPMLTTYGKETIDYNLDCFRQVLSGDDDICIRSTPECSARVLKSGKASGPFWGGNLSLINSFLGTPGQIDTQGAILMIEDVGEKLYAFDRLLLQLRHSGCLDSITGLLVGEMLEMGDTPVPFGKTVDEIVMDVCGDLDIPIVTHFPCGHGSYQATLPISHPVELDASGNEPFIHIPEAPVS